MATVGAPCAHCGKPATHRCLGCADCPTPRLDGPIATVYCNEACQKAHFTAHGPVCQAACVRRSLAAVCCTICLAIKEYARNANCSILVTEEVGPDDINVKAFGRATPGYEDHRPLRPGGRVFPLPQQDRLWDNLVPSFKDKVLLANTCQEVLLMHHMPLMYMLRGLAANIEIFDCIANVPALVLGGVAVIHTITKITLHNGEAYVFDPTGLQFDWIEVLVPWRAYIAMRSFDGKYERRSWLGLFADLTSNTSHTSHTKYELNRSGASDSRSHFAWIIVMSAAFDMLSQRHFERFPISHRAVLEKNNISALGAALHKWLEWWGHEMSVTIAELDRTFGEFKGREPPTMEEAKRLVESRLDWSAFRARLEIQKDEKGGPKHPKLTPDE